LIHIFDDEWLYKREIVKSRLKAILGVNSNTLYARNCEIREVFSNQKDEYLIKTHIQGADKSSIRLGAFIEDKLVGVMTFSRPRKSVGFTNIESENAWELLRFASDSVIGLASKFLKHFIINYKPSRIVTFADRRWTPVHEGCLYEKIGFTFISETHPNYWYTKNYRTREHRFGYRKAKLVEEGYDANKTESEIMKERGYDRVWDCGSFRYELKIEGNDK
jgi:hypothetical protein